MQAIPKLTSGEALHGFLPCQPVYLLSEVYVIISNCQDRCQMLTITKAAPSDKDNAAAGAWAIQ